MTIKAGESDFLFFLFLLVLSSTAPAFICLAVSIVDAAADTDGSSDNDSNVFSVPDVPAVNDDDEFLSPLEFVFYR